MSVWPTRAALALVPASEKARAEVRILCKEGDRVARRRHITLDTVLTLLRIQRDSRNFSED